MNYLLHRQRTPGAVIPVPDQLKELMYEISREVLREQPGNIINFIADYLEDKLVRRENQVVANKVVSTVLDTSLDIIELLDDVGLDRDKAELAVQMIRDAFHKHFQVKTSDESLRDAFREAEVMKRLVDECGFTEGQALKAGKIIERAYKTYFLRNVYKEYHGPTESCDWKEAAQHTLGIYAASGATKEEIERAAIRIQKAYRAYYGRKRRVFDEKAAIIQGAIRKHQERQVVAGVVDELIDDAVEPKFRAREEVLRIVDMVVTGQFDEEIPDEQAKNEAALKIQSAFRGKRVRKELGIEREVLRIPLDQPSSSEPRVSDIERAATVAQSYARGHLVRRQIRKQQAAAVMIQSLARGHLARKHLSSQQQQQPPPEEEQDGQ